MGVRGVGQTHFGVWVQRLVELLHCLEQPLEQPLEHLVVQHYFFLLLLLKRLIDLRLISLSFLDLLVVLPHYLLAQQQRIH
jgi:hypothetical protein